jgi:hypothetical protein
LEATSGAAPKEDKPNLNNTGKTSTKIFMFPNRCTGKATKKMLLEHNLQIAAQEMNIMPGLHLALVSVPKLADAGYTTVLPKNGAAIYNNNTTPVTASNPPILESDICQHTGMWRLKLDPKNPNTHSPNKQHETPETTNVIFDLPSSCKTLLWYHASAGFLPKETYIIAIRNRNYATWPKLTVMLINQYFPNLDKTVKGHLKHLINKTKSIEENYRKLDSRDQNQGQKITFPPHPNHQNPQRFLPH